MCLHKKLHSFEVQNVVKFDVHIGHARSHIVAVKSDSDITKIYCSELTVLHS